MLQETGLELASKAGFPHAVAVGFVDDALEVLVSVLKRLSKHINLVFVIVWRHLLFILSEIFRG